MAHGDFILSTTTPASRLGKDMSGSGEGYLPERKELLRLQRGSACLHSVLPSFHASALDSHSLRTPCTLTPPSCVSVCALGPVLHQPSILGATEDRVQWVTLERRDR